ncbi:MAG TPA: insulinase family protein, partial [Candidatus Saccharimonadales bacterium]|nr:insulinase family protein [Candidatus Saccharimonadales bacterium]
VDVSEIAGAFGIGVTARPGESLGRIEKAVNEELTRFILSGPTADELQRVKTQYLANFIRGLEKIGGFGGKSDILAMNQVFLNNPDYYKISLRTAREATSKDLQNAAKGWLSDGDFILEVHPFPAYATAKTDVDRSKLPVPTIKPEVKFPELKKTTLSNGLKVILAERHTIPVINATMIIDAGYAADQFGAPGTAKLSMSMLDEGTKTRSSLEINDQLARLGASLSTGSDLDTSHVNLSAMKPNLDPSLELFADVILNPSFPEPDFKRLQKQQLDAIQREKSQPVSMALRVLPKFLYGDNHAYSLPFTGSGTTEAVSKLGRGDAQKFYSTFFKPNNAALIVVGDTTLDELTPKLEKLFKNWTKGEVPKKNIGRVQNPMKPTLYVMDRPGSIQSMIFTGELAPPKSDPQDIALSTMNNILGGTFTSRMNMNLREDKHWSYGVHTVLVGARAQRPFITVAPVQTDKTKESMSEILKEFQNVIGKQPIDEKELAKAQKDETLKLSGAWETSGQVAQSISEILRYDLPENYYQTYPDKVLALNTGAVNEAARNLVKPKNMLWVVVGDLSKIEAGLRDLGLGEIQRIDTDGNLIK